MPEATLVLRQRALRPRLGRDGLVMRAWLVAIGAFLIVGLIAPLYMLLSKSLENKEGEFAGLANFTRFFAEPGLSLAFWNSLTLSLVAAAITVALAFAFAFGLKRSAMPAKPFFRVAAMIPLLAPSLLPAIALIYFFGKQGIAKGLLFGHSIYGPIGIVMGEVVFSFPHAVLIVSTALSAADQRLYEAARTLSAGPVRTFMTVTLPGCRYGIIGAFCAVFTLVFTDFGVPAVVGGSHPMLATEVYKQVVGRFDFEMGAVVGIFLLLPAVFSFAVDQIVQRRQTSLISSSAVPVTVRPHVLRDAACLALAGAVALVMAAIVAMAAFASLIRFWPYNLTLSLRNYDFGAVDSTGWDIYANSLMMAASTAFAGTFVVFIGAYLVEKMPGAGALRGAIHLLSMMPLAVPGLVLGLAYIFFFNHPGNPLNGLYGTLAILVLCTIVHFYTVPHLTALTALKQLDREFESTGASLRVPFHVTLRRVTVPICMPTILDIWTYYFVNAMTTVSAVIFLYTARTKLAAITIVQWNDGGKLANAAALSMVVFLTCCAAWMVQALLSRGLLRRTQAWRRTG